MNNSHRSSNLAFVTMILAMLACQVQPPLPQTATPQATGVPPTIQVPHDPTATLIAAPATLQFPTVVPLATNTVTATPSISVIASPTVTATPSGPAAKLEFTLDDINFSLSPKRKGDNKVQLTITLHPRGGREPFSFVIDNAFTYPGLSATLDWHNCGPGEPHSITVVSGDGQKSNPIGIMFPYDC